MTIARSSPACTQWYRNAELSTPRAATEIPNDTFDKPEHRQHARQLGLDPPNAFDRLTRVVAQVFLTRRDRERQHVEDEASRAAKPCSPHARRVDAAGDLDFAVGRVRHALLVDGHGDHERAVLLGQPEHEVSLLAAALEVERVEDRAARVGLQRQHRARRARCCRCTSGASTDDLRRLTTSTIWCGFVDAFGQRHAHVEQVRATLDLVARDAEHAVVLVGQQQALDFATALGVDPLADQRRRRVLAQLERADGARRARHRRAERASVRGARPAIRSTTDCRCSKVVPQHPPTTLTPKSWTNSASASARPGGSSGYSALPPPRLIGMPALGMTLIGRARVLNQVANRLAHVLGARRAVEPDDVGAQALENGQRGADVGAQQHAPVRVERHLDLQRQRPSRGGEAPPSAEDRGLGLEDVLLRLDDQQVCAALEQAAGLLVERLDQRLEA